MSSSKLRTISQRRPFPIRRRTGVSNNHLHSIRKAIKRRTSLYSLVSHSRNSHSRACTSSSNTTSRNRCSQHLPKDTTRPRPPTHRPCHSTYNHKDSPGITDSHRHNNALRSNKHLLRSERRRPYSLPDNLVHRTRPRGLLAVSNQYHRRVHTNEPLPMFRFQCSDPV